MSHMNQIHILPKYFRSVLILFYLLRVGLSNGFLFSVFVLIYLSAPLIITHAICPTIPILLHVIAPIMQRVYVVLFLSKTAVAVLQLPSLLTLCI